MKSLLPLFTCLSLLCTHVYAAPIIKKPKPIRKDIAIYGGSAFCAAVSSAVVGCCIRGKQGKAGAQGAQGLQGERGVQGNQGQVGPQGPIGVSPFVSDQEASIDFRFSLSFQTVPPASLIVVPFVSAPDGKVRFGSQYHIEGRSNMSIGKIQIDDPILGTYHVGIHFIANIPFTAQFIDLTVMATASRNDTNATTIIESAEWVDFSDSDRCQMTSEFTYNTEMIKY